LDDFPPTLSASNGQASFSLPTGRQVWRQILF